MISAGEQNVQPMGIIRIVCEANCAVDYASVRLERLEGENR